MISNFASKNQSMMIECGLLRIWGAKKQTYLETVESPRIFERSMAPSPELLRETVIDGDLYFEKKSKFSFLFSKLNKIWPFLGPGFTQIPISAHFGGL